MGIYLHDFTDAENVFKNFSEYDWSTSSNTPIMSDEEKADIEILLASYTYQDYSGSAFVLFRKKSDGKLYEVNGSHCSCYGLEGQWLPEETNINELKHRLENGRMGLNFDDSNEFRDELLGLLEKMGI